MAAFQCNIFKWDPHWQVQAEIKKTWARWHLTFEWEGPVVCGRYGSVVVVALNHHNNSTSSQSHLAGGGPATRSTPLVSGRTYQSAASSAISAHATLPGYVISGSEPPSIPEEPEDSAPKRVDDISLTEDEPPQSAHLSEEEEAAL